MAEASALVSGADPARPAACPACGGPTAPRVAPWLGRCEACGLWCSSLEAAQGSDVDLAEWRSEALGELRRDNFRRLLDELEQIRPLHGMRVLEVGCGDGWFLEQAQARGATSVGLEPDAHVARSPQSRGLTVRVEPFPLAAGSDERFDVIAFNDVFEHLPDPVAAVRACRDLLAPGGLLVLNLPDSRGALYRLATLLARIGIRGPFEQLWQKGLPSPHRFYFDAANLERIVAAQGFALRASAPLPAMRIGGLWARLALGGGSAVTRAARWLALVGAYPVLTWLAPADILLQIHELRSPT